ncbi:MFS general substrate transporter [Mycena rebaudengoi]|nr:MFS general substrate transporter [Mycena rebaudengoi]
MPLLLVSYGLQYYDKAVFGSAAIFGMLEDLMIDTTRYATASSAFYWGYIVACYPMAFILQKFPLGRTLSAFILIWGVITMLTVVCTNYAGIVAQRVFLGIIESAVSPGFLLLTGLWYKREEQPSRIGFWYSATGLFSIFSGAVNYGIGKAAQGAPLSAWKYLYFFTGAWTILWAVLVFFFLPDNPASAWWLTPEERKLALLRLKRNQTGGESKVFKFHQVKEALFSPQILAYFLMGQVHLNGGVTAFGSQIVKGFGYSSLKTTLMITPAGATTAVSIWVSTWIVGRWKNTRTIMIPITCIPVLIGAAIIWKGTWQYRGLPLVGYNLLGCFGAPYVLLLSLSTANVAGYTKKASAFSAAAIFVGYNVGNIAAPYLVDTTTKAQHYPMVWINLTGYPVVMAFTSLLSILLRFYFIRENSIRDQAERHVKEKVSEGYALADATDKENS